MNERRVGVNLLSFNQANLAGAWFFVKRIIEALPATGDVELLLFCQNQFDLENFIKIPAGIRYRRVGSSMCRSRTMRILYEQTLLPFKAMGLDVLFSPIVGNPVLHPGLKTVTTIHDLTPFFVKQKYGPLQGRYVRFITRTLAASSTRIVTVSENTRSDLVKCLGVDPAKINVVYNFVPPHTLDGVRYEPYFLTVGTLQPGKNLPNVIRSFAIFAQKYDSAGHKLIIVGGRGWRQEDYGAIIREAGMESRIRFAGYLPDDQLNALYAGCKGVILLSLYEGFGIPPLEGLTWNKPSIVSNTSSLPEVVGRTGIQVDPLDCEQVALAMKAIADDPTRYLVGREEQLARFSPSAQVDRFLGALGIN